MIKQAIKYLASASQIKKLKQMILLQSTALALFLLQTLLAIFLKRDLYIPI